MPHENSNLNAQNGDIEEFSVEVPGSGGARKSKLVPSGEICFPKEGAKTVWEVLERGCRLFGNNRCLGWRNSESTYAWMTYNEFMERSRHFGSGLVNIGMPPGQSTFVGIYGKNTVEWLVAEYGCFSQSAVVIPIYDTLGPEASTHMLKLGEIMIVICDDECKARNILQKRAEIPTLKHIIVMQDISEELKQEMTMDIQLHSFKDIEALGEKKPVPLLPPLPSDVYMVCFTSGTTGDPKGAQLTNQNFTSCASAILMHVESENIFLTENDVTISYLPLAHIFEHVIEILFLMVGGSIGFYSGNISLLTEDIKILQPTFFAAVPRVLNKLYDKAQALFHPKRKASSDIILGMESPDSMREKIQFDPSIYKPFHYGLGGKIRIVLTASAPISEHVLNFFRHGLCYKVVEAYGQTECGPCTLNVVKKNTLGSVGCPLPYCLIKLIDVPEMGYYAEKKQGEVCVKGNTVFKGYLKNSQKTAEILDSDGWLHTGDVGVFLPNGCLKIVDRITNLFKLSQGEFISPEKMESIYSRSQYVSQVIIYGDSLKDYVVAIVIPEKEEVLAWNKENLKCENWNEVCKSPGLKQLILSDMCRLGKDAGLCSFEQVKNIYIYPEALTFEAGHLTVTMKTKRAACKKFFKEEIAAMYGQNPH